jgi:uncharacterized protein YdeI (YjbR/CyaY-like superfamily)
MSSLCYALLYGNFKRFTYTFFDSPQSWRTWLQENYQQVNGVWLKLAKKSSDKSSVSYSQALEEALCYGWIDGQKQTYDNEYWLQKFSPRGQKSTWSKINVTKAEMLIKSGKMRSSGIAVIDAAKQNGWWKASYDSPSTSKVPADFQLALDNNPNAKQFFKTLNKANVYAFCWRIQTAKKPETREARIEKFINMLNRG